MPFFPTQDQLYRLLERELPEGAYIDGAPTAGYSTADMYATAKTIANVYATLKVIYLNEFPQSTVERIDDWEIKMFGATINADHDLAYRQDAILRKIRSMPSITTWQMLTIVVSFLPIGVYAQVVALGCGLIASGWRLSVSRLSSETILGWADGLELRNPQMLDLCDLVKSSGWRLGSDPLDVSTILSGPNSWQDISTLQAKAYTFEVRIFGYTLSPTLYQAIDLALRKAEPARSTHIIQQNLSLAQFALTVPVLNVTQSDGINCIALDPTQASGYSGLKTPFT